MLLRLAVMTTFASARDHCTDRDMEHIEGGLGLYDLIMSCASEGSKAAVKACIEPQFNTLDLSDHCTRCIAEFFIESENAAATGSCASACAEGMSTCQTCADALGDRWESACSAEIGEINPLHT